MKHFKKRAIVIVAILICAIIAFIIPGEKKDNKIKVGVSDDCSGIIIDYLIRNKGFKDVSTNQYFEAYSMKDCCSNTASWALSSQLLDIAIMCPDSAENLIKKDSRFEILGPCILNSDIYVIKGQNIPTSLGISQNRNLQETMIKSKYGDKIKIIPMLTTSLPYALEKGNIDGIVIDATKGFFLKGTKITGFNNKDKTSYVLVVSKRFKKNKRYEDFLKAFKESTNELNNSSIFIEELKKYKNINISKEEVSLWNQLKIKFVFTIPKES